MLLFELPFLNFQYFNSGSTCFSLFKTPVVLEHLFAILFTCFFHVRLASRVNPRKFYSSNIYVIDLKSKSLRLFSRYMKNHIFRSFFV